MFLIPTYVAESRHHGVGVFTPQPLARDTVIWEFREGVDLRLSPEVLESVPEPLQARLRRYCYLEEDGQYVLCGDNAKFMNHSFESNCIDPEGGHTITARDIRAHEELTCDYRLFDVESAEDGLEHWRSEGEGDGGGPG